MPARTSGSPMAPTEWPPDRDSGTAVPGSKVRIRGQMLLDVTANPFLQPRELARVTGGPQPIHWGLGERLILPLEFLRCLDEVHRVRLPCRVTHRVCEIQVGPGPPGPQVKQSVNVGVVKQPQHDIDHIADPDEVSRLLPIRKTRDFRPE